MDDYCIRQSPIANPRLVNSIRISLLDTRSTLDTTSGYLKRKKLFLDLNYFKPTLLTVFSILFSRNLNSFLLNALTNYAKIKTTFVRIGIKVDFSQKAGPY